MGSPVRNNVLFVPKMPDGTAITHATYHPVSNDTKSKERVSMNLPQVVEEVSESDQSASAKC